jgi:hypothetical protein
MRYEPSLSKSSEIADEHIFYFSNNTSLTISFYPMKLWTNIWRVGFIDPTCPIIRFETPGVQLFADLRGQPTNVVRNMEF